MGEFLFCQGKGQYGKGGIPNKFEELSYGAFTGALLPNGVFFCNYPQQLFMFKIFPVFLQISAMSFFLSVYQIFGDTTIHIGDEKKGS